MPCPSVQLPPEIIRQLGRMIDRDLAQIAGCSVSRISRARWSLGIPACPVSNEQTRSDEAARAILILPDRTWTARSLAEHLGVHRRSARRYLRQMRAEGIITPVGPNVWQAAPSA